MVHTVPYSACTSDRTAPRRSAGLLARLLAAMLAMVLTLLTACGGGGSTTPVVASISVQPVSTAAVTGTSASFSVTAVGDQLSLQWQISTDGALNWRDIAGATGASYQIASVDPSMNGQQYRVQVTGAAGSATSSAVALTVTPAPEPPVITTSPGAQTVVAGASASFSVTATGTSLSYQWQASPDDVAWSDLAGANLATLVLNAVALGDSGRYFRAVVGNGGGSITSASARLMVTPPADLAPTITSQPLPASVVAGQSASFSVSATGTPAPTYQWQQSSDGGANFSDIAGATGSSYTTPTTAPADSGKLLRVAVSSPAETVFSAAVLLTVGASTPPVFTLQPGNLSVVVSGTASFTVAASGTPTPTYQWQLSTDGGISYANINGATAASYTTPAISLADGGNRYRAMASNSAGSANSDAATLTVAAVPPTPAGNGGQCAPNLLLTPGRVVQVQMPSASSPGAFDSITYQVNGSALFEGHAASELQAVTTGSLTFDVRGFFVIDPNTSELTAYGSTSTITATVGASTIVSTSRKVNTPPYISREFALSPGQSTGPQTSISVTTEQTTIDGVPRPATTTTETSTSNITFVGYETITIPAGTFNTCKFTTTRDTTTSTSWALVGYGVAVKNGTNAAQAVLVNGVALTRN
jgi:hypothetical protein